MDRKGMKANARKAYKRHYWMIVVICLFASVFGVAYSSSTWSVNASSPSATVQEDGTAQSDNVSKVLENLLVGDESQAPQASGAQSGADRAKRHQCHDGA